MIKRMFGDEEEMLLEVLLNQGQSSASNVIFLAVNRLMEAHEGFLFNILKISLSGYIISITKFEFRKWPTC